MEKIGKSRTCSIFDENSDRFNILAYFTIAIQVLKIPEEMISGRQAMLLDGFSSKIKGVKITEFPSILIGQLGKNENFVDAISGSEVMEYCLATILEGQTLLGGRIVILECKNIPHLFDLYEMFGFNLLEKDYADSELVQMFKILSETEIIQSDEEK
ncbi:hypothetical protein AB4027_04690 [Alkalibacterium putridalgicola]|uniref:hypothetical protein n=1 Tax=Alkalibacterium putridalgicola TaxID=426703 RepID=UPI0034CFBADB